MDDAESRFQEGMKHIGLSRHADYHSEYVGDLEDAVHCFDRALALDPSHAGALSEKGTALAALGRHVEAVQALEQALGFRPDDADLWLEQAGALYGVGRDADALAACDAVLRLRPGDADATFRRAEALDRLRRDVEALAAWQAFLQIPDTRTFNFHGAKLRWITGDVRRARASFATAGALARLGRRDEALGCYRALLEEGAATTLSTSEYLSAALACDETARVAYQAYIEGRAADSQAWRTAGGLWLRAARSEDALAAYERAIQLAPGNPDGWYGKAEALFQAGRRVDAIAAYREALRIKPDHYSSARLNRVLKEIGREQSDSRGPG